MPRPPYQRPQHYAVAQEQLRHDDALNWFGEMTAIINWWKVQDYEAGLVTRCTRCWATGEAQAISAAYEQAIDKNCPVCYGTTFTGGYKAILYVPVLWDTSEISDDIVRRGGETHLMSANVQAPSNVIVRDNDTFVRLDGTRWRIAQPRQHELSTGFGHHHYPEEIIRSSAQANLQDPGTVDYLVPVVLGNLNTEGPWPPAAPVPDGNIPLPDTIGPDEGWIMFTDSLRTSVAPLVLTTGTWTALPNNAGAVSNQGAPSSAVTWWNSTTGRFMPPQANDQFNLQISFQAFSPVAGRELEIELWNADGVLYRDSTILTTAGVPEQAYFDATVSVTSGLVASGAAWRVRCNGAAFVYDIQLVVRREFRA